MEGLGTGVIFTCFLLVHTCPEIGGRIIPALGPSRSTSPGRLSSAHWSSYHERENDGPGTYSFGYDIDDPETQNTQFRQEERLSDGTVKGSYGLRFPDGNVRIVHYVSDKAGFRLTKEERFYMKHNSASLPRKMFHSPTLLPSLNFVR